MQIKKRYARRRHHRLEHRQRQRAQHARGHAQPARTGPEDRGIQAVPAQPRAGRHPLQHLRPHGQRHLDERAHRVRGASAREFDQNSPDARGNWDGKVYTGPLSHGREFTTEEIWENYTYFIKQVAPVAEENGVRIGIHPDDPPVPVLAGVPRCIFSNFDGYKRGDGRSPTARTWGSVSAAARGSKAARS